MPLHTAPRSAFRAHYERPPVITSPLFGQLIDEWIVLNDEPSTATTIHRWARLEPALAGHTWPRDIVDTVDAAELDGKNAVMLALLRLVQAGHQLAGRILLQQMLPSIGRLTKTRPRNAGTAKDDYWAEDRRHIAVAEFWDLITHYPTQRRTSNVPGTLHMEMVQRLFRHKPEPDMAAAGTADEVWRLATLEPVDEEEDTTVPEGLRLVDVLSWGRERDIISAYEAELLSFVYIDDDTSPDTYRRNRAGEAAERYGIKPALVRLHCHRATQKLGAAVQAQMTA